MKHNTIQPIRVKVIYISVWEAEEAPTRLQLCDKVRLRKENGHVKWYRVYYCYIEPT